MGHVMNVFDQAEADVKTEDTDMLNDLLKGWTKAEIDAAIQSGLDEIAAGREAPAAEVEQRLRAKLGL